MKKEDIRIVFMGTPEFAVESLRRLVEEGYNIVGVITMPDKPIGRHQTILQLSPVKSYAQSVGLNILQPIKLKDPLFLDQLQTLHADLQIVVAFRMLPEVVWNMPPLGTLNLHASLLPQYRGAAPINWAIINGEKETGLTTFFLKQEIDTGDIIQQVTVPIYDDDNAETLHDRLMSKGGKLIVETVDHIINNTVKLLPQSKISNSGILRPAPKIFKETCQIDWNQDATTILNFIRGLSPYPAAWTVFNDGTQAKTMKIFKAAKIITPHSYKCGTGIITDDSSMNIAVKDGFIRILDLQLSGKRRLDTNSFICGYKGNRTFKLG